MSGKRSIVILGAGFGGLRAAVQLAKKIRYHRMQESCEIILIDRNAYHTYTPTLYEAATTSKETANYFVLQKIVTVPIQEIVGAYGVTFMKGEVSALDIQGKAIRLGDGQAVPYDHLILALGAETNYFDIPGLKENSVPLKTFIDSIRIRDKVFELLQDKKNIRIIVGGGGSTGVELAGEIDNWFGDKIKTSIVEAGPSLMLGFPNKVIEKIQHRLADLGTRIITNSTIQKVAPGKVTIHNAETSDLLFDLLIWTGGVKACHLMASSVFKTDKRGRVEVDSTLKAHENVYGIGDAICFTDPRTGKPVSGVARAAISQADIAAHNVWCDIVKHPNYHTYQPADYPYVIPVGGKWAVAKLGPFIFWGFWGWVLKCLVEANYLLSVLPLPKAMKNWLKGLRIFIQNDRLG